MQPQPFSVLLSRVWIAMVMEVDNAVEAAMPTVLAGRFRLSYAMWANGLRVIGDGLKLAEVAGRSGARVNLPGLERWGWIRVGERGRGDDGFGTGRGLSASTLVTLTRGGAVVAALWLAVVAEVEERWRSRFGGDIVDGLRSLVDPGGMPWSLPEVHPSDGFRTEVTAVLRQEERPLIAVLGGALTAVTIADELEHDVALPLRANLLHALLAGTQHVVRLPEATGLSKEAVSMSLTVARRLGLVTDLSDRSVALSERGFETIRGHEPAAVASVLEAVLNRTDALRETLRVPDGGWRASGPYASATARLLARPCDTLPRHPMPLHRGGWPDGS